MFYHIFRKVYIFISQMLRTPTSWIDILSILSDNNKFFLGDDTLSHQFSLS